MPRPEHERLKKLADALDSQLDSPQFDNYVANVEEERQGAELTGLMVTLREETDSEEPERYARAEFSLLEDAGEYTEKLSDDAVPNRSQLAFDFSDRYEIADVWSASEIGGTPPRKVKFDDPHSVAGFLVDQLATRL